jgi:phage terminase large subunit
MDKPSKIMSSEYDVIFVQEAIELTEHDWECLSTRLRNNQAPYQQLMADTNPDAPMHWLKRRADAGRMVMLESRHEDNPILWDRQKGEWTSAGITYLEKLDALTGPRKARLRRGQWVQAEGVVYDGWDRAVHIRDPFPISDAWPRFLVVDFGYTNPLVAQWWAQDDDGRLYRYRELYQTKLLVEDAAKKIKALSAGEPRPRAVICDHDAEDRATLERHLGRSTIAAKKEKSVGIQAVQSRLRVAGDNKPRLFVLRDSLVRRDTELDEAKRPCCLEEEIEGYVWDMTGGKALKDEPIKLNDHALDCMRYLVMHADNPPPPPIVHTSADWPGSDPVGGKVPEGIGPLPGTSGAGGVRKDVDGKPLYGRGGGSWRGHNPYGHLGTGSIPF